MSNGKKEDSDFSGTVLLALVGVAVAASVAIPTAVAVCVYLAVKNYLGRREYLVLASAGLVGLVWQFPYAVVSYALWLKGVLTGQFSFTGIPWLFLALTTCMLVGIVGLLMGTRIAAKLPPGLAATVGAFRADPDAILPTEKQKQRISVVKPAGALTVDSTAHSVLNPQEPGKRSFPIGIDVSGAPVMLSENEIRMHGLILGSTGSGKSETIKALAGCLLDLGWSGMLLDLKEDTAPGGLRDWCFSYAQSHGTPYQELCLSNPHSEYWFNPIDGMGPDEIRDTILTLQEFDDQYWQALSKQTLGQLVNLVMWAHQADPIQFPAPTMYDLGRILSSTEGLNKATKRHRAAVLTNISGVTKDDFAAVESPAPDAAKNAVGFGSKLTVIYETQAGRTVLRPGPNNERRLVDVTLPGLTYVGLDSQGKADLTKVISSAILQRMSVYAAMRTTGQITDPAARTPRFLIVDEANWVDRTIVQNLLSRARAAGIAMFLCTQGPKDWIDKNGDDWGKLTQNVNVTIIMSQGEPESAELCADYIGHVYKKQVSEMVRETRGMLGFRKAVRTADGEIIEAHSSREVLTHRIDPDDLRRMGIGEAIIRVGKPSERISWMKVMLRDPTAAPVRR